jgi:outer membrane protein assembly factor BamB
MAKGVNCSALIALLVLCSIAPLAAAELAETPWPMFHHYPNHTGTSPHYGPNNSSVAWTFSTGDNIFGSAAVGDDGTIYVGTRGQHPVTGSRLYAIHPNGTERWHWRPSHYIDSTSAIADDGTLYVGSWDKRLYAINPDGTMKWEFSADGGFVYTSPAIGSDGTIYIGNNDGRVYAVHPDGTKKWSYQTLHAVQSSPAIAADGTIYVGSNDRKLYAINPDGTLKWSYTTGDRVMSSPAIAADGTVYVGSDDGRLYAFHQNGALKWTYTTGYCVRSSPAIDSNGTIYVGSGDKKLYALYQNGTLKWSYATGGMIWSSPAIDADGTIYVGAKNGYVYAINPNGTLLWTCDTGGRIYAPSPTIDADGMIYTGNEDGDFYAIGPGIQPNRPPVLDPIGDKLINETETLVIALSATDPNEDVFNCSCNRTDLFADFDPVAGTGSWTPGHEDSGIYLVEFNVSDGRGGTDNETITIEVLNVNRHPLLDSIGNKVLNETETLVISLNGSDPDGDTITYSCNRTDLFTDFDLAAGIGSWTPGYEDSGMYWIEFGVSDSNRAATNETITIEVLNVDRPPVLDPVGNKVLNETETLLIYLNGSDPDGDPLTYSASNLPAGARS